MAETVTGQIEEHKKSIYEAIELLEQALADKAHFKGNYALNALREVCADKLYDWGDRKFDLDTTLDTLSTAINDRTKTVIERKEAIIKSVLDLKTVVGGASITLNEAELANNLARVSPGVRQDLDIRKRLAAMPPPPTLPPAPRVYAPRMDPPPPSDDPVADFPTRFPDGSGFPDDFLDGDDGIGGVGVREPRRPLPGSGSGAAAKEPPKGGGGGRGF